MTPRNMISRLRQRVLEGGKAEITAAEYDQLQAEWITRAPISADLEEVERLKGALFEMTADRDSWIEQATMHSDTALSQAQRAEQAERRAERLKVHAEAMAEAIQFGDLAILTVAKVAAEAYRNGGDGPPLTPHGEAIAAGDGTLHGAIDYWQQQAFTMAAGQCCVESGGLMADDHGNTYCDMQRQRDELRGRLRVMANIMSDALDAIKAVEGDCSDEDEALMHLRAKMASAMDSVKRADMKAAT